MKSRITGLFCVLTGGLVAVAQPSAAQEIQSNNSGFTRGQMAQVMLSAEESASYTPPACIAGSEIFNDVPASSIFCPAIEELARRGITAGCGGGNYCPGAPVNRAQMAVFQVKALTSGGTARAIISRSATVKPEYTIGTWTARRATGQPTGVYCVAALGVDPDEDPAIVTVEWGTSFGFDLLAYWNALGPNCGASEYEVRTYDFAAGGAPALSNDVTFMIVIP